MHSAILTAVLIALSPFCPACPAVWFQPPARASRPIPSRPIPSPPDPIAAAVDHFPPPAVCDAWIDFGERHAAWIEARLQAGLGGADRDALSIYLMEVRRRLSAWQALHDARCCETWGSDGWRKERLQDLQDLLGQRDFLGGCISPPLDVRLFRRID